MFKRKTVMDVLEKHDIYIHDEIFPQIYKRFRRKKCKSKIKSITYKEICQLREKNPNNWLHIIQENSYRESRDSCWEMNPFQSAVIIVSTNCCLLGIFYQTIRIFTYTPSSSSDIIPLPNFSVLVTIFKTNLFHIYRYNEKFGKSCLVTQVEDLHGSDKIICVSKNLPYIVMEY